MPRVKTAAVIPQKGWHVLHLFYRIEHGQWYLLSQEEKIAAKTQLSELIQEIRATDHTQLLIFSIVSPKADIGFMLLTPDLHIANAYEKRLSLGLGPDVLQAVYSFVSLTEEDDCLGAEEAYALALEKEQMVDPHSEEFQRALEDFRLMLAKQTEAMLYPKLPHWEVFCFYPMTKSRPADQSSQESKTEFCSDIRVAHARVARQFEGKVSQLLTVGTGLDDADLAVSLFAHDTSDIRQFVGEWRSVAVKSRYAEFGDFYIGLSLPLDMLFRRVLL